MSDSPDIFALSQGLRVLVTAGRIGYRPRDQRPPHRPRRARAHLRRLRRLPRRVSRRPSRFGRDEGRRRVGSGRRAPVRRGEELARRPRRSHQQRRRRRADRRRRGDPARGLAAHDRRLPHRAIPLRASRRADAQERGRRRDRQSVLGGRTLRIRVPHPLLGGQMGRHRLHPEPRQGARPRQYSRQRDPPGHCRGAAHDRRDRGARQADRCLLRGDGEDLSRSRLAAAHGDGGRRRRHGRLSALPSRPQHFRPDRSAWTAMSKRCDSFAHGSESSGESHEQSRRHRSRLHRPRVGDQFRARRL